MKYASEVMRRCDRTRIGPAPVRVGGIKMEWSMGSPGHKIKQAEGRVACSSISYIIGSGTKNSLHLIRPSTMTLRRATLP